MQPAIRSALLAGLLVIIALFLILAEGAADTRSRAPDTGTWLVIPGIVLKTKFEVYAIQFNIDISGTWMIFRNFLRRK